MKLKFYLRGLGIGIVVTALLMGMAQPGEEGLTDARIKERAAQLGMVDKGALTLDQKQNLEENRETEASKATEESETMETSKATEESETTETSKATEESETTEEAAESEEPSETEEFSESTGVGETKEPEEGAEPKETSSAGEGKEQENILLTIQRGDNSSTVSRKLEEAGVIADAKAYDRYLCDNGYATVIRAGTYEIPIDGTEEKIAGIITGKE